MTTNANVVRGYQKALMDNISDLDALKAAIEPYITEDCVCVEPASLPWAGHWVGTEGFAEMVKISNAVMGYLYTHAVGDPTAVTSLTDEFVSEGDTVMRWYTVGMPGTADIAPLEYKAVEQYKITDGRISFCQVFFEDTAAMQQLHEAMQRS